MLGGNVFRACVAKRRQVDAGKQVLARTHQNRTKREMQFIDELRAEVLLNRRDSAADPYIFVPCSLLCALQGGVDSVGNKVERCSAFHLKCLPWMVRQHKRRYVIRRLFAPPPSP